MKERNLGQVEYGAHEVSVGKLKAYISVQLPEECLIFLSERSFSTLEEARDASLFTYLALSGEQTNLKFHRDGLPT